MVLLFLCVALAPLALSGAIAYLHMRAALTTDGLRSLAYLAARTAAELDSAVQGWEHATWMMAADPRVAQLVAASNEQLYLLDPRGGVMIASRGAPRALPEACRQAPSSPVLDDGGAFVVVAHPAGGLHLCGRFPVERWRRGGLLARGAPRDTALHVVSARGVVASSEPPGVESVAGRRWYAAAAWEAENDVALSAYAPVAELRIGVVAVAPRARVLGILEQLRAAMALGGGCLLALLTGTVWLTARSMTRPLGSVVAAAQRTAAGERGARVPLRGSRELVALGEAFNQMSASLKDSQEHLEQRIASRTEELERSRGFVELLLDSIDQVVLVLDRSLRVVKMNRPAERLLGERALGASCGAICGEGEGPEGCASCLVRKVFATRTRARQERPLRIGERSEILVVEASPIFDARGEVDAVVQIGRVVTDERRLQAQMVHQEKMATFGLLAAGIAHEIGNPLASIHAQLRLTRNDPARVPTTLGIVEREVGRIATLLRQLSSFVRRRRDVKELVSPNQLLEDVAQLVAHDPRRRDVAVELRPAERMAGVRAKADELLQVVLNLALNALDAMGGTGTLVLETALEGGEVAIRVRDSGPGVSPEAQARMFEPFFTTKPAGRGTGLGLFVSKGIIEALHGELLLEATGPSGSVFCARLPADAISRVEAIA